MPEVSHNEEGIPSSSTTSIQKTPAPPVAIPSTQDVSNTTSNSTTNNTNTDLPKTHPPTISHSVSVDQQQPPPQQPASVSASETVPERKDKGYVVHKQLL